MEKVLDAKNIDEGVLEVRRGSWSEADDALSLGLIII